MKNIMQQIVIASILAMSIVSFPLYGQGPFLNLQKIPWPQQRIINVPNDYGTIQEAIDAANDGDIVLVEPNTYKENIDFLGKKITVKSTQGPDVTTIDGTNSAPVVLFMNGENDESILEGFTITNGYTHYGGGAGIGCYYSSSPIIRNNIITSNMAGFGGGIGCCSGSSPIIINNIITANSSIWDGGGIYCNDNASPIIKDNIISGNSATGTGNGTASGGGIYSRVSSPTIENNIITDNSANGYNEVYGGGIYCFCYTFYEPMIISNIISNNSANGTNDVFGGGIYFFGFPLGVVANNIISYNFATENGGGVYCEMLDNHLVMVNNTITGNSAGESGGGIYCDLGCGPKITNSIIWENSAPVDPEIHEVCAEITYCDIKGGAVGTGNINADPLFVDPDGLDDDPSTWQDNDFHIPFDSPCKNKGNNSADGIQSEDFEEDPRIADGTVDIGADEFHPHLYYIGAVIPGQNIDIKVTGEPNAEVMLGVSQEILDPPVPTPYGDRYLKVPIQTLPFGNIPQNGVLVNNKQVPGWWNAGEEYACQALIKGATDTVLTNLMVLEVE